MISERLKLAMKTAGVTQAQLARACGVKPPSVHGWLNGKAKFLRGENLLSAARFLEVSQVWLATGRGAMNGDERDDKEISNHILASRYSWPFHSIPEDRIRALSDADRNKLEGAMALILSQIDAHAPASKKLPSAA